MHSSSSSSSAFLPKEKEKETPLPSFASAACFTGTSRASGLEASEFSDRIEYYLNKDSYQCCLKFSPLAKIIGEEKNGKIRRGTIKWFDGVRGYGYISPDRTDRKATEVKERINQYATTEKKLPSGLPHQRSVPLLAPHRESDPEDEQDVYVSLNNIKRQGFGMLYIGDQVEFVTILSLKNFRHHALEVTGLNRRPLSMEEARANVFMPGGVHIAIQTAQQDASFNPELFARMTRIEKRMERPFSYSKHEKRGLLKRSHRFSPVSSQKREAEKFVSTSYHSAPPPVPPQPSYSYPFYTYSSYPYQPCSYSPSYSFYSTPAPAPVPVPAPIHAPEEPPKHCMSAGELLALLYGTPLPSQ